MRVPNLTLERIEWDDRHICHKRSNKYGTSLTFRARDTILNFRACKEVNVRASSPCSTMIAIKDGFCASTLFFDLQLVRRIHHDDPCFYSRLGGTPTVFSTKSLDVAPTILTK